MSSGPNCELCPRNKAGDDSFCDECQKNYWHRQNIRRCQYAWDREHGKLDEPQMKKSRAVPAARKKPKKRTVPAEFRRQREREKEIQRKMENFELTDERRAAREEGLALLKAAIFG